jgi:hypothetical protein
MTRLLNNLFLSARRGIVLIRSAAILGGIVA